MLSQKSAQAIARLRAYTPPPTQWYNCPLTRRAAVLILLFPDRHGDLKVVLTMRAATLRNYAGQAALPGGKADHLSETPFHTARREAHEEIGLPVSDAKLPPGFYVEHLCELPTNLAKTELGVRPCVAFLSSSSSRSSSSTTSSANANIDASSSSSVEDVLIPRLDPKEVSAVFTAPFHNFLKKEWQGQHQQQQQQQQTDDNDNGPHNQQDSTDPHSFYRGTWTDWHDTKWRMHNFYIPTSSSTAKSKVSTAAHSGYNPSSSPSSTTTATTRQAEQAGYTMHPEGDDPAPVPLVPNPQFYRVFGMTARILVDAARVAYGEEPDFEHNSHHGDEEMIGRLLRVGRMSEVRGKGGELTVEVLRKAVAKDKEREKL